MTKMNLTCNSIWLDTVKANNQLDYKPRVLAQNIQLLVSLI